jgi:tyrosinase
MMAPIRKDIRSLTKIEMDTLIRAWGIIENTPPDPDDGTDNPKTKSFFNIAGFHGEPFRGAGYNNPQWWGGYCHHGNVLFPTWHRAYLLCLENALREAVDDNNLALPYWNQLDPKYKTNPIPEIFLQKTYRYDGTTVDIKNPLYSYSLSRAIYDRLSSFPDADYSKYKGYQTVRYPFSGLVGTEDVTATDAHNSLMNQLNVLANEASIQKDQPEADSIITDGLLQSNVSNWLRSTVINDKGVTVGGNTADLYYGSLTAPNYTVFSNTTSAQRWNDDRFDESFTGNPGAAVTAVVPLEKPHNSIHLAVGGFEVPGIKSYSYVPNANGDMGENDTAAFDPIFYFHHCFIDLVFWSWQSIHKKETQLDLLNNYPGMNSVDSQGPTPGIQGNVWLSLKTPLAPFGQTSDASGTHSCFFPSPRGTLICRY